jgi:hypothetical protein
VARGSTWRYLKGIREASDPPGRWRSVDFDDASWVEGAAPVGYGDPPFGTQLDDMAGSYSCVFLRRRFEVPRDLTITGLSLTADYDDGLVAWINGVEVRRINVDPGEPAHDDFAAGNHESGRYERFSLPAPQDYLLPGGDNVLAIQGLNVSLTSSDFKIDAELSYTAVPATGPVAGFVRADSNGDGAVDISDAVHMLLILFVGAAPGDCDDARDVDDNGLLDVTDPIALLDHLFRGGPRPPPPFPHPGPDPTLDSLGCEREGP